VYVPFVFFMVPCGLWAYFNKWMGNVVGEQSQYATDQSNEYI